MTKTEVGFVLVVVGAVVLIGQPTAAFAPTPEFWMFAGSVFTTLAGFIYTWFKDARQHRWDERERLEARKKAIRRARRLERQVVNVKSDVKDVKDEAKIVADRVDQAHIDLASRMDANTVLTAAKAHETEKKINDFIDIIRKGNGDVGS
jgi:hypothetical protein